MVRDVRFALTLLPFLVACPAKAPQSRSTPPHVVPTKPVVTNTETQVPALRLPRFFVPSGYAATLVIDPAQTTFSGVIAITGDIAQRAPLVWLHGYELQIKRATATSKAGANVPLSVIPHGDVLEIRAEPALEPGTWVLGFEYTGKFDTLNTTGAFRQTANNAAYVYSQFEALYARRVFPCLDEPDSKVPWQLTLEVPKGVTAVSNTPVVRETAAGANKRVEFARTKPLPSYLIAFGVGPFDIVDAGKTKSGIPVRIVAMKGRSADAAYAAKTTARILDLLEEWFAIPYPYEKLDMLVVPVSVGFSAMENAGLVTTTERAILFDKPSWQNRRGYVSLAAHELAHQWFGDLVTMVWWDDIWLNEGFATWLGHKITNRFDPSWHGERGDLDIQTGALDSDSIVSARKIRQPIEKVDDIYNVFDGISYTKGAAVLNMFESFVGAEKFQAGVRQYLKSRAFGNATSAHFVAAISGATGRDLVPAFSTFLDQPGAPEIEARLDCGKGAPPRVELVQQRFVPPGSPDPAHQPPWHVPMCVAFERDGKRADACTLFDKETSTLALDAKKCPRWLMPNANGRGYYRSRYTAQQVATLRDEAWPQLSWSERRSIFFDVASAARYRPRGMRRVVSKPPSGKLPLALVVSLVPKLLAGGDRFTLNDALGVPLGLERFVAEDQRTKYEAWVRGLFAPAATKLGLMPRDTDDLDTESVRVDVLRAVAWTGRDPELVKQCVELAKNWRDLPIAIRGLVLQVAADANPDLHAKLMRDVKTEPDRARREEMFSALVATRDIKRVEAALELTLDPQIDMRESSWMLLGTSNEATRKVAERFVRVHKDKILARLPKEAVTGANMLTAIFTASCDPAQRDEALAFVTANFGNLPGAERGTKQAFEGMDQCIASRKALEPELRAFLTGVKLPKPKDKPAKS